MRKLIPRPLRPLLQRFRNRLSIALYRERSVSHRFGGVPLTISLSDPLAQSWYDRDWPIIPEIALLQGAGLRRGARVFNLGAHQGVVGLMLADTVGRDGFVVAVEAHPHNARAARRNVFLNGASQMLVVTAAVGATTGVARISGALNARIDHDTATQGLRSVRAVTVDSLAAEHGIPDVLYVDVEGAECEVLQGAIQTLRTRPDVVIEVHVGCGLEALGGSVECLTSALREGDYDLYVRGDDENALTRWTQGAELPARRFFIAGIAKRVSSQ